MGDEKIRIRWRTTYHEIYEREFDLGVTSGLTPDQCVALVELWAGRVRGEADELLARHEGAELLEKTYVHDREVLETSCPYLSQREAADEPAGKEVKTLPKTRFWVFGVTAGDAIGDRTHGVWDSHEGRWITTAEGEHRFTHKEAVDIADALNVLNV